MIKEEEVKQYLFVMIFIDLIGKKHTSSRTLHYGYPGEHHPQKGFFYD